MSTGFLATVDPSDPKPPYIMAFTKAGRCARASLLSFSEPSTRTGRTFLRLNSKFAPGDEVVGVSVSDGSEVVSVVTRESRASCFPIGDVNVLGGAGKGVTGMKLSLGDFIMGFKLVHDRMDGVECVTNRGKSEIVRPNKYKPSARGGRGREIVKSGHIDHVTWSTVELKFPDADEDAKRKVAATEIEEVAAPRILEDKPLPAAPAADELAGLFGAESGDPAIVGAPNVAPDDIEAAAEIHRFGASAPSPRPSTSAGPALRPETPRPSEDGPPLRASAPKRKRRDPFTNNGRLERLANLVVARTKKKKDEDDQGELF